VPLELQFIKPVVIKGSEFRGQPTEGSDKSDLRADQANHEAEPGSLGKRETVLGFRLHLGKRISHCQEVRDQLVAAITCKCKIADSVSGIEGATDKLAAL
jgi:hypothetical protein